MQTKKSKNTKKKIVAAAWKLFYDQGYDCTTVDDIVDASGTSKGSFYHYFEGKDALLGSLSILFDERYEELLPLLPKKAGCMEKLLFLNQELFSVIENTVPLDMMARLFSTQLTTKGEKHLLDHNRIYYRLLRQIAIEGQQTGEFRTDLTANEITKIYAMCERALMYDWCICNGDYSLRAYAQSMMPRFLEQIKAEYTGR